MSYCRFSCDDWKSDVYCYSDVSGGISVHVAASKIIGDIPKTSHLWSKDTLDQYYDAYKKQIEWLKTAERVSIGLPHGGESFNFETVSETVEWLFHLRELGYHVPDHAIESLLEDLD